MRTMHVACIALAACTQIYEGEHTAVVTGTIVITAPAPATRAIDAIEEIAILEGDLSNNSLVFERPACKLDVLKHGGYGLAFEAGQRCERDGSTWTLTSGGAPNEDTDTLAIDLAWTIDGLEQGTATEALRIDTD